MRRFAFRQFSRFYREAQCDIFLYSNSKNHESNKNFQHHYDIFRH
jgi:hypothetical protein